MEHSYRLHFSKAALNQCQRRSPIIAIVATRVPQQISCLYYYLCCRGLVRIQRPQRQIDTVLVLSEGCFIQYAERRQTILILVWGVTMDELSSYVPIRGSKCPPLETFKRPIRQWKHCRSPYWPMRCQCGTSAGTVARPIEVPAPSINKVIQNHMSSV